MVKPEYTLTTPNIWFPDQREPVYDTEDFVSQYQFKEYWKQEKDRCINGFYIADGKVKVPGRLYFHTVYARIAAYIEKQKGNKTVKSRELITPYLLDTVWDIFNDVEDCTDNGKFYDLVGSRDFGKSITAASCAAWQYTFFPKSEAVISGGESSFIKLATDKIEDILINLHPVFKKQRITSDWKKEIVAGWKDKKTNLPDPKSSMSSIKVRNYENGVKSMAANGTRPGFHLIDEIGTIQYFISCLKDSDGCWWSGGGDKPSCLVMCCGTGGDMEVGTEAAEVFFNPESYNMLSFDNPEGGRMGRFISALRARMKYKDPWTLYRYLTEKLGMELQPHPDLDITILVSDEQRALKEWWEPEYLKAQKSGNQKTITKFLAYWPLKASDSFLVLSQNVYNTEAAKLHQSKLKVVAQQDDGFIGTPVELFYDGEQIRHKISAKKPVTEFPVKSQTTDCPVMIYEFPVKDAPFGLYIAGVDPYKQDMAESSDSLGSVYIYKRMHSITGEEYQDMFVASYVSRPNNQQDWLEQARLLVKYFNAYTLSENEDMVFIRYMQNKGDDYLLCDQPHWLKDIVPGSTVNRGKGIHASKQIIKFLQGEFKMYLDEVIGTTEDGREILGVSRVRDIMLLEEIIKNRKGGNFDRERAASIAVALANKMVPMGRASSQYNDSRFKGLRKIVEEKKTHSPLFTPTQNKLFSSRRNRLFR